ncbi:hypothetical protein ACFC60_40455 [Kitasatospora purpeofusca]|uniref:hypothetical protein n=1 Tax=Kitasatospora purpeofusca TaxID=67352 RepID=UPI0035D75B9C
MDYPADGAEHLCSVGAVGEAFDNAMVHVLAVGEVGQPVEDGHVELLLRGEAGESGLLGGQEFAGENASWAAGPASHSCANESY